MLYFIFTLFKFRLFEAILGSNHFVIPSKDLYFCSKNRGASIEIIGNLKEQYLVSRAIRLIYPVQVFPRFHPLVLQMWIRMVVEINDFVMSEGNYVGIMSDE